MTAPAVVRRWADPPAPRPAGPTPLPDGGGRRRLEQPAPPISRPEVLAGIRRRAAGLRRIGPLGAVLGTAMVAHVAAAPHLTVMGAAPEALLVTVAAVAVGGGPRVGAAFGFAAGLGADLFLATPLGTAALAYTIVGHVLGGRSRTVSSGTAAALCRPDAPCFACRTGGLHEPDRASGAEEAAGGGAVSGGCDRSAGPHSAPARRRPPRVLRRSAIRRAWLRQSMVLTAVAVALGRVATVTAATALAGVTGPRPGDLVRIVAAAAVSVPLGPPVFAAVRRIPGVTPAGGRR